MHKLHSHLKKDNKINNLDPSYISAFEELKQLITSHPFLKYPDFNIKLTQMPVNLLFQKRLTKHNTNREQYIETRVEGYIDLHGVRHKDEPKF